MTSTVTPEGWQFAFDDVARYGPDSRWFDHPLPAGHGHTLTGPIEEVGADGWTDADDDLTDADDDLGAISW